MKYILALFAYLLPFIASAQDTASIGTSTGASGAPATPGVQGLVIQLGIIFVIFYVLLIRPQQKKVKQHAQLMAGLKKGDKVITGAGFVGTVIKSTEGDKFVDVEIANGVNVKVIRSAITELLVDKKEEKK
jgi:preprotein translocase subunit YajC